jgi:hypothetical protein
MIAFMIKIQNLKVTGLIYARYPLKTGYLASSIFEMDECINGVMASTLFK